MRVKRFRDAFATVLAMNLAMPALAEVDANNRTSTQSYSNLDITGSSREQGNVIADQELIAIVANVGTDASVIDQSASRARVRTGDNSLSGDAFSTFSGVLTQSVNSGANAVVQAAANIAISGR
jgi:hypothetical protein